jgi:CheY-like chemotaxis protein
MSHRVLVIDDEPDIRDIAAMALRTLGNWTVSTAGSGAEGESLAVSERPDVILLDVMMPGLDGQATARRIRAHPETSDVPILLFTASTATPSWAEELGVRAVLAKPFDPFTLPAEVERVLGGRGA